MPQLERPASTSLQLAAPIQVSPAPAAVHLAAVIAGPWISDADNGAYPRYPRSPIGRKRQLSGSAHTLPNAGQSWSIPCQVWSELVSGQLWLVSRQLWPKSVDSGRRLVHSKRTWSRLAAIGPDSAAANRIWSNLVVVGSGSVEFGPNLVDSGSDLPRLVDCVPKLHQVPDRPPSQPPDIPPTARPPNR